MTISVSQLKAHLSAELRKVKDGEQIVVVEHKRPVAVPAPYREEPLIVREPQSPYQYRDLQPLTEEEPASVLRKEREERW